MSHTRWSAGRLLPSVWRLGACINSLLFVLLVSGCASQEAPGGQTRETPAAAPPPVSLAKKSVDPQTAGILKGAVTFQGAVPPPKELSVRGNPECAVFHKNGAVESEELVVAGGGLKNVFVYVKEGLEGFSFEPPVDPLTLENKGCVYVPHVSGAQVGQPVIFLNQDPTLHNIHSYSKNSKPWNLGLPFQGMKQTKKFAAAEVMVTLKCDVHPWMTGYVGVLAHPYFAVSGARGEFEIKNLPPGDYTIEAWHEKLGVQTQRVRLEPRETKEIEFSF